MANIASFKTAAGALGIAALASILTAAPMASGNAADQSALQVPQSISYEHEQIIKDLTNFAKREVAHAAAAQKALVLIKTHYAKEEAIVLPALACFRRSPMVRFPRTWRPRSEWRTGPKRRSRICKMITCRSLR